MISGFFGSLSTYGGKHTKIKISIRSSDLIQVGFCVWWKMINGERGKRNTPQVQNLRELVTDQSGCFYLKCLICDRSDRIRRKFADFKRSERVKCD